MQHIYMQVIRGYVSGHCKYNLLELQTITKSNFLKFIFTICILQSFNRRFSFIEADEGIVPDALDVLDTIPLSCCSLKKLLYSILCCAVSKVTHKQALHLNYITHTIIRWVYLSDHRATWWLEMTGLFVQ